VPTIWFEDLCKGQVYQLGSVVAEDREVIAFARRFDPQLIHTDPEWAERSQWGQIIAPGMWTTSSAMRRCIDNFLSRTAAESSPGLEGTRWLAPVRLGDRLDGSVAILDTWDSSRGDHLGTVRLLTEMRCGDRVVLSMTARGWFHRRRPAG
jgi:acyl dehydratase